MARVLIDEFSKLLVCRKEESWNHTDPEHLCFAPASKGLVGLSHSQRDLDQEDWIKGTCSRTRPQTFCAETRAPKPFEDSHHGSFVHWGIDLKEVDFPLPQNAKTRVEASSRCTRNQCGHAEFDQDAYKFKGSNAPWSKLQSWWMLWRSLPKWWISGSNAWCCHQRHGTQNHGHEPLRWLGIATTCICVLAIWGFILW